MAINNNPAVERYVNAIQAWTNELKALRAIVRAVSDDLYEDFKWKQPVYTLNDANVLIIGSMKDSCVIGFFKGALMDDPHGYLQKPGPNTQAARRLHFTSVQEVKKMEKELRAFIQQGLEIERSGRNVERISIQDYPVPEEFQEILDKWNDVRHAFESLPPGCRREYLMYFSSAKKSATRRARIEKSLDAILEGKRRRTR